jgi:hypothetical protein
MFFMKEKANQDIRYAAKAAEVCLWEISDRLGIADSQFSIKLRHELPVEEKTKIHAIIAELKVEAQ